MAQIAKIDGHRFGITKQERTAGAEVKQKRQQNGAYPMDVRKRVERDAAHHGGCAIAKVFGGIAMCGLMQGDGKDHRNGIDRNGLNEVRSVHSVIVSKSK